MIDEDPSDLAASIAEAIKARYPSIETGHAEALAFAWSRELTAIIGKTMEYAQELEGFRVEYAFRDEVIVRLTHFSLWMIQRILDAKAATGDLSKLDPEQEIAWAGSEEGRAKIENTARLAAEHLWAKLLRQWNEKSDRFRQSPGGFPTARRNRISLPKARRRRTLKNHYIPQFVTEKWADQNGRVTLFSREIGGAVTSSEVGHGTWSFEFNLYSDSLEEYLGVLESDASHPYRKFCRNQPLDAVDVRSWITFIIIQWLRSPLSASAISAATQRLLQMSGSSYLEHPAQMKRTYETLFSNHGLYEKVYRNIERRPWLILSAPTEYGFLLGESHIALSGALMAKDTMIVVPLSPDRCFVAYHHGKKLDWPLRYRQAPFTQEGMDEINSIIAESSSKVICRTSSREIIAPQVEKFLSKRCRVPHTKHWWGRILAAST